jgi:hypothetical protein
MYLFIFFADPCYKTMQNSDIRHTNEIPEFPVIPELPPLPMMSPFLPAIPEFQQFQNVAEPENLPEVTGRPKLPDMSGTGTSDKEMLENVKQQIQAQLECLLCIENMVAPIQVCCNGHMICHNCRPKLNKCHLCR